MPEIVLTAPPLAQILDDVARALSEDMASEDLSAHLISRDALGEASLMTREPMVAAGQPWATEAFRMLDPDIKIYWHCKEGSIVKAGTELATIKGRLLALLAAERTAINFLQTLSATATLTRRYVEATWNLGAKIVDTRKTVPGLRRAQKYAVLAGGGANHRMHLAEGLLIKENHIAAAGGIAPALASAFAALGEETFIQIEVENIEELHQALNAGARHVLLDNFSLPQLSEAVEINQGRAVLEASGGITLKTVAEVAKTGVDRISIGSLTKNIKAMDLSMRVVAVGE